MIFYLCTPNYKKGDVYFWYCKKKMTHNELILFLDEQINRGDSFAIYRIPGERHLNLIQQHGGTSYVLNDLEDLNEKSGFVIAPFVIGKETPLVLITGKEERITYSNELFSMGEIIDQRLVKRDRIDENYKKRFETFIKPIKDSKLEKLVLSRMYEYPRPDNFSVGFTFLKACQWYIRSYVYLFHTPQTGTWLGSTPEIILSGKGQNWHTVALAGTQTLQNGELPETWNNKNKKEQALVVSYIRSQLNSLGITPVENGPYTVRAAELAHLKTDFTFKLPDNVYLGSLLKLLHPTPAVCGLPKEEAYEFILENEAYNRRYYSGFIGMLNGQNGSNLYVNLRCMEIMKLKLCLYAGGGLLPSSTVTEEWQETEDKMFTMRKIIQ
jgi:isochorismate synthases